MKRGVARIGEVRRKREGLGGEETKGWRNFFQKFCMHCLINTTYVFNWIAITAGETSNLGEHVCISGFRFKIIKQH